MGYKLCTAEKPSVASDIARVVGASKKERGYYIGNGYIVTWAVGHLVGLAEPNAYGYVGQKEMYSDDGLKDKAYQELPLLPQDFKLIILERGAEQFEVMKTLMHRTDVDEIIDCGDMGAEGHILQWFIREKAGCKKPVRRFCATSMTDEAIKDAMGNLRDITQFSPIIRGEFCKKKEDWILGMSLSRALSIKHHTGINVGRVQSPTLGFVVNRFLEVENFKVTKYYTMDATIRADDGSFHVFWDKDVDSYFAPEIKTNNGRVLDKSKVDAVSGAIRGSGRGVVTELVTAKKATDRPQLYDITELQRDANRRYGYSAAVTLATAQALYETQKVLSYPRTDSKYITHDLVPYMADRVAMIATINQYSGVGETVVKAGLNIDKKICDDTKVTDHHALIVTEKIKGFNMNAMTPTETEGKNGVTVQSMIDVLDLVISRMLISFSKAFRYEQTSIVVSFDNGFRFTSSGKKPVFMGWKEIERALGKKPQEDTEQETQNDEQFFPNVKKGMTVIVRDCATIEKKTTPPKLHTEATLLTAMENAGQQISNGAILKGKGIGTQATRAEIIKKLFDLEVVETVKKGKTPYIKPTAKGLKIIAILPPDLYSPKITADWETRISEIVEGKTTEAVVMKEFEEYIKQKTEQIKTMETKVSFTKEREIFGYCPWCGKEVYRYQNKNEKGKVLNTRFYCSDKCDWELKTNDNIFSTRLGRNLTEAEAKKFIAKKFVVLDCRYVGKQGKYKGEFTFYERTSNGKRYCNVACTSVKGKLKQK